MVKLYDGGAYLVNRTEIVPEAEAAKVEALTGKKQRNLKQERAPWLTASWSHTTHQETWKALLNLDKVITFGSVEGRYDVCIEDTGKDELVKTLKKLYEPVGLEKETVR